MSQKFNQITLGVNDLEKSLAFYEKGLGWKKFAKAAFDYVNGQTGNASLS